MKNLVSGIGKSEELSDTPSSSCRADALDLLAMADTLTTAIPKLSRNLAGWRQKVMSLLAGSMTDDLETEWQLEELAMGFRREWITLAHLVVADEMKSPPSDHLPLMPVSLARYCSYERLLKPRQLEEKIKGNSPEIPGWQMEVALFSSGMAAITSAITVLRHLKDQYHRADSHTLQLDMLGGYFETLRLINLLNSSDLSCQGFQDQEIVLNCFSKGKTDILFLELIAYDWKQSVVNPAHLLDALATRPADDPWILIVDSTLLGPMFDIGPFLTACGGKKPILVLEIRSGLKLDQAGLEFSNVGIIKTLTPEDLDNSRYLDSKQFQEILEINRKVLGTALSLTQIAMLDAPWIFHQKWMAQHSQSVFDNNRQLAFALSGIRGLFARVNHPCLSPQSRLSWAKSPIVVMEFHAKEDNKENWDLLRAVMHHEIRQRKLVFHMGASFGFRHHRAEVIFCGHPYTYPDGKSRGFFKVAMGARNGPSMDGVIRLMQELAAFPGFQALRMAYPQIKPECELARFPDIQTLKLIK